MAIGSEPSRQNARHRIVRELRANAAALVRTRDARQLLDGTFDECSDDAKLLAFFYDRRERIARRIEEGSHNK